MRRAAGRRPLRQAIAARQKCVNVNRSFPVSGDCRARLGRLALTAGRRQASMLRANAPIEGAFMRLSVAVVAFLSAVVPAAASGGLSCDVEDKSVRVAIASGVTRGMGSPIFQFKGTLEILGKEVTADLRKTEFDGAHVAQYWLDHKS